MLATLGGCERCYIDNHTEITAIGAGVGNPTGNETTDKTEGKFDIDKIINNEYDFLNVSINFGKSIDWNMPDLNHGTRLWKLNFPGFPG